MEAHVDFETCSCTDLRSAGVYRYVEDPTTRVLCLAWAIDDSVPQVWDAVSGEPFPPPLYDHIKRGGLLLAWNANFERIVWKDVLARLRGIPYVSPDQWRCAMTAAAYYGLPLHLEQAGHAIGLRTGKDMEGHALMLRMCRPRSYDAFNRPIWWHESDPERFDRLKAYCKQDVIVERSIARRIGPLPDSEQCLYELDQDINDRGIRIDVPLAKTLAKLTAKAQKQLNAELAQLTEGRCTKSGQVQRLGAEVERLTGRRLPDLRRDTVLAALVDPDFEKAQPILRIRSEAARTSTAKLNALARATGSDGRMRGCMQFYGAFRTGRWAHRLLQPGNMPRPLIKNVPQAVEAIEGGWDLRGLDLFFGDSPLGVVSSCLRGCVIPSEGNVIIDADFSQVEARIVAWLAGQQDVLDVFAKGEDIYEYTAAQLGSYDRQHGKIATLQLGFQSGAGKLQAVALKYGVVLSEVEAEDTVFTWRKTHDRIVALWYSMQKTAVLAVRQPKHWHHVPGSKAKLAFQFDRRRNILGMRLPSGRTLCYREPQIGDDGYGPQVTFMGLNQYTHQWVRQSLYGGRAVENATQATGRDFLAYGMNSLAALGLQIVLHVHDDAVLDTNAGNAALVREVMERRPPWAADFPLAVDVKVLSRWGK